MKFRPEIFILSLSALSYEILLIRLLSIVNFSQYLSVTIALALLGYGVSGTFLSIFSDKIRDWRNILLINSTLFSLAVYFCPLLAQMIAFNPLELVWGVRQIINYLALFTILSLPFFFVANCIGILFKVKQKEARYIYASDLAGAGFASVLVIALLNSLAIGECFYILAIISITGSLVIVAKLFTRKVFLVPLFLLATILILPIYRPQLNPYKGLNQALLLPGANVKEEYSSSLGYLTLVENQTVPFRIAPGLSLTFKGQIPHQQGLFVDGDNLVAVNMPDSMADLSYLSALPESLAFTVLGTDQTDKDVLLVGFGGGAAYQMAQYYKFNNVLVVEPYREKVDLTEIEVSQLVVENARFFLQKPSQTFRLIMLPLDSSMLAQLAGVGGGQSDYLYTVESMQSIRGALEKGGLVSISRWLKIPPRDAMRILATALQAGFSANEITQIRTMQTTLTLLKHGEFESHEISLIKKFCDRNGFDLIYYPGIQEEEANISFVLKGAPFFKLAQEIVKFGKVGDHYPYNLSPVSDSKPYFSHFVKTKYFWDSILERQKQSLIEGGYYFSWVNLGIALFSSIVLILLPLSLLKHKGKMIHPCLFSVYFFFVGFAFMIYEIALLQQFQLFLGNPIYSVAAILGGFLLFAGLGSLTVNRWKALFSRRKLILVFFSCLTIPIALLFSFSEPIAFILASIAFPLRVLVSLLFLAPAAFAMGTPFVYGLQILPEGAKPMIPWLYGINGCASVVATIIASLFMIHFGFYVTVVIGIVCYLIAGIALIRLP